MKFMKKILTTRDYTLIFSDPDVILYGSIDGNSYAYMDEAEEFAKSFFSKDIMLRRHRYEEDLKKAKQWLMGILYHERKNSVPEVMGVTGYKSVNSTYMAIRKFGPLRSIREGAERTFLKRYGESMSEAMSHIMQKKSEHMKDVMTKRWRDDKDHSLRDKVRKGREAWMKRRKGMVVKF